MGKITSIALLTVVLIISTVLGVSAAEEIIEATADEYVEIIDEPAEDSESYLNFSESSLFDVVESFAEEASLDSFDEDNRVELSFYANGGTFSPGEDVSIWTTTVEIGENAQANGEPWPFWKSDEMYFSGWYDNPECAGNKIDLGNYIIQAPAHFYAGWVKPCILTFVAGEEGLLYGIDENGEEALMPSVEIPYAPGEPFNVNYIPYGEHKSAGNAVTIEWRINGTTLTQDELNGYIFTQDTTLEAVWHTSYTITFYANGGKFDDLVDKKTVEYPLSMWITSYYLPTPTYNDNTRLVGWSEDGTEAGIVDLNWYPTRDLTLYPVWGKFVPLWIRAKGAEHAGSNIDILYLMPRDTLCTDIVFEMITSDPDDVTFTWYKESKQNGRMLIEGETGNSLHVEFDPDVSSYTCTASNSYGGNDFAYISVAVDNPLSIRFLTDGIDPIYRTYNVPYPRGTVSLEVEASAEDETDLRYEWTADGTIIPGETSTTLSYPINKTTQLSCRVYDRYGNSRSADVEAVIDNKLELKVLNPEYDEGYMLLSPDRKEIELLTSVSAIDMSNITYEWIRTDTDWETISNNASITVQVGTGATSYECRVNDGLGNTASAYFTIFTDNNLKAVSDNTLTDTEHIRVNTIGEIIKLGVTPYALDGRNLHFRWEDEYDRIEELDWGYHEVRVNGSATYRCIVSDQYGNASTVTFFIDYVGPAPKCQHKWDSGKVTKSAECTKTGILQKTCQICKEVKTETIPALGHNWSVWAITKKATGTEVRKCSRCGAVETRSVDKLKDSKNAKEGNESGTSKKETDTTTENKMLSPLKVEVMNPTVESSKKKISLPARNVFKVSAAHGKISYRKKSGDKALHISKAGKITIAKGTKKGTYKMKVTVTDAGNEKYKQGSKTITVKIKIK